MSDNDYVEDINEIIGAIPPWVMRCGVTTIIISFLLILCALIIVQLPQTISGDASIIIDNDNYEISGIVRIKPSDLHLIKTGQNVTVNLNSFTAKGKDTFHGVVSGVHPSTCHLYNGSVVYCVEIAITDFDFRISQFKELSGRAEILVGEMCMVEYLFSF